jgi:hypothetical protein
MARAAIGNNGRRGDRLRCGGEMLNEGNRSMIPKSGYRFSEKIMLQQ